MKELARENAKLERLMPELSLERQFLKDVAKGMFHDRSSSKATSEGRIRSQKGDVAGDDSHSVRSLTSNQGRNKTTHPVYGPFTSPQPHLGIGAS